jgi:general secretion pathway protein H
VLGPSAILPPQRIVLTLGDQRLELASDGLGPFEVSQTAPDAPRP